MNEFNNGGEGLGGGRFLRGDQMLDEFRHDFVKVRNFFGPQAQHIFQGPRRAAVLAEVVDRGEAMIRGDDGSEQAFRLQHHLFIQRIARASDGDLFHDAGEALGEECFRHFRVLVLVVMQQFEDKGQFGERNFLLLRLLGGGLALLDFLVQRQQGVPLVSDHRGVLLEHQIEVGFERQHDLVRLGARVQFRIGRQVVEKNQRRVAEFPDDAFARHLALEITARGPHDARIEKVFRARDEGLQQLVFQRHLHLRQLLHERLHLGGEVTLHLVQHDEHLRLRQAVGDAAVDEAAQHVADLLVVLHELRNDYAHFIDREFADQAGEQQDQFAVGFLPVLDDPLDQLVKFFVLVLEAGALHLQLAHPERQLMPPGLNLLHRSRRVGDMFCVCHGFNMSQKVAVFPIVFSRADGAAAPTLGYRSGREFLNWGKHSTSKGGWGSDTSMFEVECCMLNVPRGSWIGSLNDCVLPLKK